MEAGLEKNIVATLRFYDFFEHPLTGYEIYKNLLKHEMGDKPASLNEILSALKNNEELNKNIDSIGGFYCLKGRSGLVQERIKKEKISIGKWRKTAKNAKILQFIPFIKMCAITGSLALSNTKPQSDLDFFIVAKTSRIWLCRLFSILLTQLLGFRRHGDKIRDRACLNSFITDKALEIKIHDLYSASEYRHLIPLWGLGLYQDFKKNNPWIGEYFFHHDDLKSFNQRIIGNIFLAKLFSSPIEMLLNNRIGDWLEQIAARYQKRKISRNPKTSWQNSQIIFNNECLIFHPLPKAAFIEKMMQINV